MHSIPVLAVPPTSFLTALPPHPQAFQAGTAITNGQGSDLSVNALYAGPYAVLVSNVHFGAARRPYAPSGAAPKASSFHVFWNVQVGSGRQGFRKVQGLGCRKRGLKGFRKAGVGTGQGHRHKMVATRGCLLLQAGGVGVM
jgi:hypothetical protein